MNKTYPAINIKMDGAYLADCKNANMSFKFKENNRILVKGYVENPQGKKIINAGVEVIKVDNKNKKEEILGVIFTDNTGKYSVSLQVYKNCSYKFEIYSPAN
ncbi:hypothetical protein [Paraclostridium sordellii]|uniref:hypothetical protein n=1 Tax=Paraclostridium sordellii TaxID=1505 RepID=UPI0022E1CFC5|nr:hypothetical protein [Paeniclostridium sordellii]